MRNPYTGFEDGRMELIPTSETSALAERERGAVDLNGKDPRISAQSAFNLAFQTERKLGEQIQENHKLRREIEELKNFIRSKGWDSPIKAEVITHELPANIKALIQ